MHTPEPPLNRTATSIRLAVLSIVITAGSGYLGAHYGYALGGPAGRVIGLVGTVAGCLVATELIRRRVLTVTAAQLAEAASQGYAEAVSQVLLERVGIYHRAVFPLSGPDEITDEERAACRTAAYRTAACEELPEPVRVAAANALAALDDADEDRIRATKQHLYLTVRQELPRG